MKNKVLKHLDQYRDKTLSFGCEIEAYHDTTGDGKDSWIKIRGTVLGDGFYGESVEIHTDGLINDDFKQVTVDVPHSQITKIIGHKLSHADLIRAIDKADLENPPYITTEGQITYYNAETGDIHLSSTFILHNYRTIEDVPKGYIMWEQLNKIFNL